MRPPSPPSLRGSGGPGAPPASKRLLVALLLLIALSQLALLRLEGPFSSSGSRPLSGDEKLYVEVATAWAAGAPAELDPLWPPGYPATIALILSLGGTLGWVVAIQIAALLAAGLALARLGLETGLSPAVAALAGTTLVVDPEVAAFARLYRPEALHLALFLGALLLAVRAIRSEPGEPGESQRGRLALLGLLLGLAIALKSLLLPLAPLVVLAAILSGPKPRPAGRAAWRDRLLRGALVGLPLAAVLMPVLAYERLANDAWTVGGSARFNLWVGLTDRSPRSLVEDRTWEEYLAYRAAGSTFAARQEALTRKLGDLVAARGLPAIVAGQWPRQYLRLFERESYFGASLPPSGSRHLAGEGYRQAPPGLARGLAALETVLYVALLVGAPIGWLCMLRGRRTGTLWMAALLGYQLALFWFVHVKSRYRLTLLPLFVLGLAWTIECLRRGDSDRPRFHALELLVGGACTAALLFCAFGHV